MIVVKRFAAFMPLFVGACTADTIELLAQDAGTPVPDAAIADAACAELTSTPLNDGAPLRDG